MNIKELIAKMVEFNRDSSSDISMASSVFCSDELPYAIFGYVFGCNEERRQQECLEVMESGREFRLTLCFPVTLPDGTVLYNTVQNGTNTKLNYSELTLFLKSYEVRQEEMSRSVLLSFGVSLITGYTISENMVDVFYGVKVRDYASFADEAVC